MKRILLYIAIVLSISISLFNGCMSEGDKIDYYISDTTLSIWSQKFNAQISQYVGNDTIVLGVDSFPNWVIKVNLYIKTAYTVQNDTIIYGVDDFEAWRTKFNTAVDSNFNNDAELLFARMTSQPTADEKQIYSNTIDSLQKYEIWDTLAFFYGISTHDSQAAKLNWIEDNYNLTAVNSPVFIQYFGYYGNGSTSYLNTNFNAFVDNSKFTRNSSVFGISLDSLGGNNAYYGATDGGFNTFIAPNLAGIAYSRLNAALNTSTVNTGVNKKIFTVNRINSANQDLFINKTKYTGSVSSNAEPNLTMYLLARNTNGSDTDNSINNINCAFAGGALTDTQIENLNDIIVYFRESMNAQAEVIGYLPTNASEVNTRFLQRALNGGDTTLNIQTTGIYKHNASIFIDDSTTINYSPNTYVQKDSDYSNVFLNIGGLTKTINNAISLNGLNLMVNNHQNGAEHVFGLRAQLGWFYVNDLTITDFSCYDLGNYQYCMEFGAWTNILLDSITIEGDKDGLDFLSGHGAIINNVYLKTFDDGVFIGGVAYPSSQLEVMGDVYDMEFTNINYTDSLDVLGGRGIFSYLGSWTDWNNGNTYKTGDFSVNSNNIYQCNNSNSFSAVAANAPVHTTGTVTGADGITWHQIDTGNRYSANIYNITIDSSLFYWTPNVLDFPVEDNAFMRTIYPGTEGLAKGTNITIKNTTIKKTGLIRQHSGLIDVTLENNIYDSLDHFVLNDASSLDVGDSLYILSSGGTFSNCTTFVINQNRRIFIDSRDESQSTSQFINTNTLTGELRAINYNLPFSDKAEVTPVLNDTCRFIDGLNYWDGATWQTIP